MCLASGRGGRRARSKLAGVSLGEMGEKEEEEEEEEEDDDDMEIVMMTMR